MEKLQNIFEKGNDFGRDYSERMWVQYTVGYDFDLNESYKRLVGHYEDKENYEIVKEMYNMNLGGMDGRRAELMYNSFKDYHQNKELVLLQSKIQNVSNELSGVLNKHRAILDGREVSSVELNQILANEEDREKRKNAYLAKNQINQKLVDAGFLKLINLRKELAKKAGFDNFVDYMLDKNELSSNVFNTWKDDLSKNIDKINEKRKYYANKYLNDDKIMPWDESYISSQIASVLNQKVSMADFYENLVNFFNKFDIDITKYNITYDVFSRKNKSEWGYFFPINEGVDCRILANVKGLYNEYGVLLHETGHGIHSFMLNPKEILNLGVSGIISEGIANLFGSFLSSPLFFDDIIKVDEEGRRAFEEYNQWKKLNSLQAIHNIFFDQELYKNDLSNHEDILDLYAKISNDLYGSEKPNFEPAWAFRIHFTTHPIYLHNYFMGDVTCEMLKKAFEEKGFDIEKNPKEFKEFLYNEIIEPSGLYKFEDLFQKISGEEFSLKYIID